MSGSLCWFQIKNVNLGLSHKNLDLEHLVLTLQIKYLHNTNLSVVQFRFLANSQVTFGVFK